MGFCCSFEAILSCPMGTIPTPLTVIPKNLYGPTGPMATCTDCIPFLNTISFGFCKTLLAPCVPTPVGIWIPTKPNVVSTTGPVLVNNSFFPCTFGGIIKVNIPGQFKVMA